MKRVSGAILVVLIVLGCDMNVALLKPSAPLENDGEVFLYLEPFPRDAERLKFTIEGISAVKDDGTEQPFSLDLTELDTNVTKRQRLLASGRLTPGSYHSLSLKVGKAVLKREGEGEEDAALLVPEEPVKYDLPFVVTAKKAGVISMLFRFRESIGEGFSFTPSFAVFIPDKPLLGLMGFVANRDSHSITLFDKMSGKVAAVIETRSRPGGFAIDQRRRLVYVPISGEDTVDVIDAFTGDVFNRINLYFGDQPLQAALTADGATLLTVNRGSNTVSFLDTATLTETSRVTVGKMPNYLLFDRTGKRAVVFNTLSNTISIIDVNARAVVSTVSTETGPIRGEFNRKGDRLYVIYETSPYMVILDAVAFSVVKRIYIGSGLSALKVDRKTDLLYVGKRYDPLVDVYDPFSLLPGDVVKAGGGVEYMTIDGEGNNLCMVVPQKRKVVMVNLITKKLVSEVDVGGAPYWASLMGER